MWVYRVFQWRQIKNELTSENVTYPIALSNSKLVNLVSDCYAGSSQYNAIMGNASTIELGNPNYTIVSQFQLKSDNTFQRFIVPSYFFLFVIGY